LQELGTKRTSAAQVGEDYDAGGDESDNEASDDKDDEEEDDDDVTPQDINVNDMQDEEEEELGKVCGWGVSEGVAFFS
jgi:hypothetical protein